MALFGLGKKKKNEDNTPACTCSCGCSSDSMERNVTACCSDRKIGEICCIKVLGSGCKNCHTLLDNTKEAVNSLGLSVPVEYVTDMQKIMEYGVMSMPALVVNEKVVAMGKVLKPADITALLQKMEF